VKATSLEDGVATVRIWEVGGGSRRPMIATLDIFCISRFSPTPDSCLDGEPELDVHPDRPILRVRYQILQASFGNAYWDFKAERARNEKEEDIWPREPEKPPSPNFVGKEHWIGASDDGKRSIKAMPDASVIVDDDYIGRRLAALRGHKGYIV